jgi:hypothetical protein
MVWGMVASVSVYRLWYAVADRRVPAHRSA